jgi:hypothetical protein
MGLDGHEVAFPLREESQFEHAHDLMGCQTDATRRTDTSRRGADHSAVPTGVAVVVNIGIDWPTFAIVPALGANLI